MKIFQKLIIKELKSKIRTFNPKNSYWEKKISQVKNGILTKIPKNLVDNAIKKSKSKTTEKKLKSFIELDVSRKKVNKRLNQNNLIIEAKDKNGDIKIFEKQLEPDEKITKSQAINESEKYINYLNQKYLKKYDIPLLGATNVYILRRDKK